VKTWEDQPRAPAGSSEGGEWTQIAGPLFRFDDGPTGILAVDQTTDALVEILAEVYARTGDGSGPLYGIEAHATFGKLVADRGLAGISPKDVEQSFSLSGIAAYGSAGSVRTDVLLRDRDDNIIAIYDLKTGSAKLSPARADELRNYTRIGADVPIIELRLQKGSRR
jgi:hypothetical protein